MKATRRRHSVLFFAIGACAAIVAGCSDNPTGGGQATVTMQSELGSAMVTSTAVKENSLAHAGDFADSLKITRVRLLVSALKMHRSNSDTMSGYATVKEGPVLMVIEPNSVKAFANASISAGSYDKVKFEFHRFSSSEISQYLNDTLFADFVTNDRSTVVIEGIVYVDSLAIPFEYKSDMTANLSLSFDPALTLNNDTSTNISLVIDVAKIFRERQSTKIHDPRDPRNEGEIDDAIRDAIKALKR